jgi:TolA-binding protein
MWLPGGSGATAALFELLRATTPCFSHRTTSEMDDAEDGEVLDLLDDLLEDLYGQLVELGDKRKKLIKQRKAQRKRGELEKVDSELEATRRILGLVEATAKELATQGQEGVHEGGAGHSLTDAGKEVRGGDLRQNEPIHL